MFQVKRDLEIWQLSTICDSRPEPVLKGGENIIKDIIPFTKLECGLQVR